MIRKLSHLDFNRVGSHTVIASAVNYLNFKPHIFEGFKNRMAERSAW